MNKITSLNIPKSLDIRRLNFDESILVSHQPEFLPWLGFISKASMGDAFFILDNVQFRKEGFQNRNKIRVHDSKGWQWLTIPILTKGKSRQKISEVNINNTENWKKSHLTSLKLSYAKSPHFKQIYDEVESIYDKSDYIKLIDFNTSIIQYAFKKFKINIPIFRTSELLLKGYDVSGTKSDLEINLCKIMNATLFVFGQYGRTYIEKEKYQKNKIKFVFQDFRHPTYKQIHGKFLSEMSFLDLLFNYGDESYKIIQSNSNYKLE